MSKPTASQKAQTAEHSNGRSKGLNTTPVYNQGAKVNLGQNPHPIKRILKKTWVKFAYVDKHGLERVESLSGRTAKRFLHLWWKRLEGLTQAGVPKGYILKDYIYLLATDKKARYFIKFQRAWEKNETGQHRRYWLNTPITWLAEEGFPELRGHITRQKG